MKTRLISFISLALSCILIALPAYAQLTPNPNNEIITVTGSITNSTTFNNNGNINITTTGTLTNNSLRTLNNNAGAAINNWGTLVNKGNLKNSANLYNYSGATFTNTGTVTNNAGATLSNSGTLNNNANLIENYGALTSQSVINNAGTILLRAGSTYDFTGGTLNNNGGGVLAFYRNFTFNGTDGGTVNLNAGSAVYNYATLTNAAGHIQVSNGEIFNEPGATFTNSGTLNCTSTGGYCIRNRDATLNNNGNLTNNNNMILWIWGGAFNNDQGATLINNATLAIQDGITSDAITNNSGIIINNKEAYFQSTINNNSTGIITNNSFLGLSGTLNNTGEVTLAAGSSYDFTGGVLNNNAGGTLTFNRDFTFNGADGGTVNLNAGGTLTNNATLTNAAGYTQGNSGLINNNGTFNNEGNFNNIGTIDNIGTVTNRILLNNTGTITNNAGGTLTNSSTGTIDNSGTITNNNIMTNAGVINNNAGATLNNTGQIKNDGNLNNYGVLTNDGTITNANTGSLINKAGGTLANNSQIINNGGQFVNEGTYTGLGDIIGDFINNGQILQGDTRNSSGLIVQGINSTHVYGNFTSTAGSSYVVNVEPSGQSDRMFVSESATLNGGTVPVLAAAGQYDWRKIYTILTAEGGVTGTFEKALVDSLVLRAYLSYDPNNVYLRMATSFNAITNLTENELNVATVLDQLSPSANGDMFNILTAMLGLNAAQLANAYDQMGGLIHTTIGEVTFSTLSRYFGAMGNRMGGFLTGGPAWNYSVQPVNLASRDTITDAGNTILAALGSAAGQKSPQWGLWAQGYGGLADVNGVDISSRYDYKAGGIAMGFDRQLSQSLLLGVSAGYSSSRVDLKDLSEFADGRGFQVSGYGMYNKPQWYLSAILGYSFIHYDTTRNMSFAGITRTADADYNTNALGAYLEGGYKVLTENVDIIPMISLTSGYMLRDSFDEQNAGALNLDADNNYCSYFLGSLGVKFRKDLTGSWGTTTPEFAVRWDHRLSNDRLALNANFSGYPNAPFTTKGDLSDTDSLGVGLGLTWKTRDNIDISVSYDGSFSGNNMLNGGTVSLKYLW